MLCASFYVGLRMWNCGLYLDFSKTVYPETEMKMPSILGVFFSTQKFRFSGLSLGFLKILAQKNPVCPCFSEFVQPVTYCIAFRTLSYWNVSNRPVACCPDSSRTHLLQCRRGPGSTDFGMIPFLLTILRFWLNREFRFAVVFTDIDNRKIWFSCLPAIWSPSWSQAAAGS